MTKILLWTCIAAGWVVFTILLPWSLGIAPFGHCVAASATVLLIIGACYILFWWLIWCEKL